ncbi:MAG: ubiquinol-cytochrome c reductase iron-sulfur subunit [Caldilineaceae bacterium]
MLSRRRFLTRLSIGVGALGATLAGIPVLGFMLSPLLTKTPEVWRAVGALDSFQVGQTVEVSFEDASPLPWAGVAAKTAAWLRRNSDQEFVAFSVNCTHLGCPVRWLQDAELFMCPCHGGVYNGQGQNVAGPPPRPLARYPVRINNGQVETRRRRSLLQPSRLGVRPLQENKSSVGAVAF